MKILTNLHLKTKYYIFYSKITYFFELLRIKLLKIYYYTVENKYFDYFYYIKLINL